MEQPYFPPWPQAFTRIETRQFGAGRASQHLALYIDLPVHPLISPRITTLILLDTVHRQLAKSLQIHAFFLRQPLPSETKDRFSCFMPRRFRAVRWLAQHTAGHQREHHIHRNYEAAEGQYRYGRIRSGEIVGGYGQTNTGVTHAAANGQYLAISDFGATHKPAHHPGTDDQ